MQLVGQDCAKCTTKINWAVDAKGCEACGKIYHKDCLEHALCCPDCGVVYKAETPTASSSPKPPVCARCGRISPRGALLCECGHELNSAKDRHIRQQSLSTSRTTLFIGGSMMGCSLAAIAYSLLVLDGTVVVLQGLFFAGVATFAYGWVSYRRLKSKR